MPLDPQQRIDRAKKAAEARWSTRVEWDTIDLDEGMKRLATLRSEVERGGLILQHRAQNFRVERVECYNPNCLKGPLDSHGHPTRTIIDIGAARFAGSRTRTNPETGLIETAYACSAACFLYMGSHFQHAAAPVRDVQPTNQEPDVVLNEAAKNIIG
jgi:hypothetical protein